MDTSVKSPLAALHAVAPPPPPPVHGEAPAVSDLQRILKLPRRAPVDCTRNPVTKRYAPATQALIEVVTARFARPKRVSCACRPRRVERLDEQRIRIWRVLPEDYTPEAPIETTVAAFVADNQAFHEDRAWAQQIESLRPGAAVVLPATFDEHGHPCINELNGVQAWALNEASIVGGLIGLCGTGSGKTISNILMPMAFPELHAQSGRAPRTAVLLIEPKQRLHYRKHCMLVREHFRVSSVVGEDWKGYSVPGTPPLHLVSYSKLSNKLQTDMLERLNPDLLACDEGHRVCGDSAINRRVTRFLAHKIKKRTEALGRGEPVLRRAVMFIVKSGTLEVDSVEDTQMPSAYALGTSSPLPLDRNEAKAWSAVFDRKYDIDRNSKTAKALYKAFGEAKHADVDDLGLIIDGDGPEQAVREGFQKWRANTLGVVSASATDCDAAIYISERKIANVPDSVKAALARIRNDWERPDGQQFEDKMMQVSCAREIAAGFFGYWVFPKHPCACPPGREMWDEKCTECTLIDNWFAARKRYSKELRTKLQRGEVHHDSPDLCRNAAERFWQEDPPYKGKLPKWDCESYPAWRDIENRVEHEDRVSWIDDFLARDAAEWALSNKGVVWFESRAMGRKIQELTSLPYFNGGPGAEARMSAEKGDRSIIVSINAHGSGTDGLQNIFCEQYFVQMPSSNATATGFEQLLARLHRRGQRSREIQCWLPLHVTEYRDQIEKAVQDAHFNYSMSKLPQKLLMADLGFEI